uniref:Uncharacterized protein n=1 Tax=Avena sativa TaxID=4498 RepID=A0ACD5TM70_AVESA
MTTAGESMDLQKLAPLEAILFDIDGTLCDSDPFHFLAFRELLQQMPVFASLSPAMPPWRLQRPCDLFNWPRCLNLPAGWIQRWGPHHRGVLQRQHQRLAQRRPRRPAVPGARPRQGHGVHGSEGSTLQKKPCRLAAGQLKGLDGLQDLCTLIEGRNLKRAAVTNAPRANAEFMLSLLGLTSFFPVLVIGSECERAKPSPDPYLKALELIGASPDHTFIFEDSASGVRAGVAAGVVVVGLTTGNPEKVLRDAGASLLIEDFRDPKLLAMLQELDPAPADKQA